jgi:hypothetical protein
MSLSCLVLVNVQERRFDERKAQGKTHEDGSKRAHRTYAYITK